jgi:hypothetical protein
MQWHRFTTARLVAISAALLFPFIAHADPPRKSTVEAPPLLECKASETNDLGTWDDAYVVNDQDFIVLRRGEELFSLPMEGPSKAQKLKGAEILKNTQIIAAASVEERLWLFMNSSKTAPFAIDATSGDVAKFEIPGLNIPGDHTPGLKAPVIVKHASAAILSVSGGDRATWPRDGNRPLYFWMDLKSGKVDRFAIGWDLEFFSATQSVAVFDKPQEKPFERRPLQAVDLKTGALVERVPDRRTERYVPYDWSDSEPVKTLYSKRPDTGDAEYFAGLSYRGLALPLDIDLEGRQYLAEAKAHNGYSAFRLRRSGASKGEPSPLWVVSLEHPERRQRVESGVADFALLDGGNIVFVTTGHGHKNGSSEAWFYPRGGMMSWNVLDGVERLPPLDKEFAGLDYIEDRMMTQLIESFGKGEHENLVLCNCTHYRGDRRALALPFRGKVLESSKWQRAVVLASEGRRYLTPLFRDATLFDRTWLHHSGKLVTGTYVWHGDGAARVRQIQLAETVLEVPRESK